MDWKGECSQLNLAYVTRNKYESKKPKQIRPSAHLESGTSSKICEGSPNPTCGYTRWNLLVFIYWKLFGKQILIWICDWSLLQPARTKARLFVFHFVPTVNLCRLWHGFHLDRWQERLRKSNSVAAVNLLPSSRQQMHIGASGPARLMDWSTLQCNARRTRASNMGAEPAVMRAIVRD